MKLKPVVFDVVTDFAKDFTSKSSFRGLEVVEIRYCFDSNYAQNQRLTLIRNDIHQDIIFRDTDGRSGIIDLEGFAYSKETKFCLFAKTPTDVPCRCYGIAFVRVSDQQDMVNAY